MSGNVAKTAPEDSVTIEYPNGKLIVPANTTLELPRHGSKEAVVISTGVLLWLEETAGDGPTIMDTIGNQVEPIGMQFDTLADIESGITYVFVHQGRVTLSDKDQRKTVEIETGQYASVIAGDVAEKAQSIEEGMGYPHVEGKGSSKKGMPSLCCCPNFPIAITLVVGLIFFRQRRNKKN